MERVKLIEEIYRRLKELFPTPYKPNRTRLEQAVFTVLSQNTTDRNAERCLENLKELTGNNLLKIPKLGGEELLLAIKPCGMFNQKLKALKTLISMWEKVEEKLRELPEKEAISYLMSFPYIGSKTARVILTFGFGKNTFPIDTHCRRVLKRLGVFPESWSLDEISRFMEEHFDGEFNRELHYNFIRLGRKICKAKNPECDKCPLKDLCRYYRENKKAE